VQDVLLNEPVGEQLAVEDFVAAFGGDVDEPVSSLKISLSIPTPLYSIAVNR
jgi:hypothetical protein